jgi:hypothetical protein
MNTWYLQALAYVFMAIGIHEGENENKILEMILYFFAIISVIVSICLELKRINFVM